MDAAPLMRDRCGHLRDQWYVACLATELTAKAALSRTILDEQLVLFRDAQGHARCFRDRCPHRNAQLSEGRLANGTLACPYHGWRFDAQGALIEIPSEGPNSKGRPGRCLTAFPAREASGLIWIWLGDADAIDRDPFCLPHHNEPGWESYFMVTSFDNNVTNCVENFMDVPHTVFVHKGWFRSRALKPVPATIERRADSVRVTYHQENDSIGFSQLIFNPRHEPITHTDHFFMPNVTRVDYTFGTRRAFIITSQCTPVGPMRTEVYTAITFDVGRLNPIFRAVLPPYTRKVIQQDVEIMANQSRSLRRYGADFANAPIDVMHHYIESLRDHAAAGAPDPAPAPATAKLTFWI